MLRLLTYLFSLIFPDQNEYLNEYAYNYDSDSDKANSMELDVDTTEPTHFFTYG